MRVASFLLALVVGLLLAIAVLLFSSGCGAPTALYTRVTIPQVADQTWLRGGLHPDTEFRPTIPIQYCIYAGRYGFELQQPTLAASQWWNAILGEFVFERVPWTSTCIFQIVVEPLQDDRLGEAYVVADGQGHILSGRVSVDTWLMTVGTAADQQVVIAHEMGHLLGLADDLCGRDWDPTSVMCDDAPLGRYGLTNHDYQLLTSAF